MDALNQNDFVKVAETFSQSDPFPLGSIPRNTPNKVLLVKDKVPDGFMFPPVAIAPSPNM
jgi:hypothetical protein